MLETCREAYNKVIIKEDFCALSWLISGIMLRCTVSKTSKTLPFSYVIVSSKGLLLVLPHVSREGILNSFNLAYRYVFGHK